MPAVVPSVAGEKDDDGVEPDAAACAVNEDAEADDDEEEVEAEAEELLANGVTMGAVPGCNRSTKLWNFFSTVTRFLPRGSWPCT